MLDLDPRDLFTPGYPNPSTRVCLKPPSTPAGLLGTLVSSHHPESHPDPLLHPEGILLATILKHLTDHPFRNLLTM